MATTVRIARKLDDTGPPIRFHLIDPRGGPFDPTGYSLQLNIQLKSSTPAKPASVGGGAFAVLAPAADGVVEYSLVAADTATAGVYRIEVEALNGTDRQTFPQLGFIDLAIGQDLGDQ